MINKNEPNVDDNIQIVDLRNILSTRQWLYDFLGKSFYMEPKLFTLEYVNMDKELLDDIIDNFNSLESI